MIHHRRKFDLVEKHDSFYSDYQDTLCSVAIPKYQESIHEKSSTHKWVNLDITSPEITKIKYFKMSVSETQDSYIINDKLMTFCLDPDAFTPSVTYTSSDGLNFDENFPLFTPINPSLTDYVYNLLNVWV